MGLVRALVVTAAVALGVFAAPQGAAITAPAQLLDPRDDSNLIGYATTRPGSFSQISCTWPYTGASSGAYVQCCKSDEACNFFTACKGQTLYGASATVACDTLDPVLSCMTGSVYGRQDRTAEAPQSYIACWNPALGDNAFSMYKTTGAPKSTTQAGGASSPTNSAAHSTSTTHNTSSSGDGAAGSKDGSSSPPPSAKKERLISSWIAGPIVGGLIALAVLGFAIVWCRRRRYD